jgi:putative peptidoglycan lipid II flippase
MEALCYNAAMPDDSTAAPHTPGDAPDLTPAQREPLPAQPAIRSLGQSAGILALGNLASRVLGLARELVISWIFGASGQVSAFRVAAQVPTLLYDFLIGGMLSAALVPVLSTYAANRREFVQLVSALATVFALALALLVIVLQVFAEPLAGLLAAGFHLTNPDLLDLTVQLLRWTAPAVWLFCVAGLLTATLYALQRFTFPALATAVYNLGIVAAAPLLAPIIGIYALAVGILVGALAQISIMAWDLRRAGIVARPMWAWRHPALGQMLRLYAPIAAGMVVSLGQIALDRRLATGTAEQSVAWMANATTLQQMPLGLVSVAIALAALPQLSRFYAAGDEEAFGRTLGQGLRMVLLLIAPAAVALWFLGQPLIELIFQHGRFHAADTVQVTAALHIYLIGMVFAAVDFPLNYAFYARKNTLLPALVGVASVGVYVVVAFALLDRLGFLGLVWADTAKQGAHALLMSAFLVWRVGYLRVGLRRSLAQIGAACLVLTGALWGVDVTLHALGVTGQLKNGLWLVLGGSLGILGYGVTLSILGMREVHEVVKFARKFVV